MATLTSSIECGSGPLRHLLATSVFDLRELDVSDFREWLERNLSHWLADPVFVQRTRVRDLRRAHPELGRLEGERRQARLEDESSPLYPRLEATTRDLAGAEKAIGGLRHALAAEREPAERPRLRQKLEQFEERAGRLRVELDDLRAASPQRIALEQATERLARFRESIGFQREVARLEELQRKQGRSSSRSGVSFERLAVEAVREAILPELGRVFPTSSLSVLTGTTLAAARMEIDQLIVRRPEGSNGPVDVLALVEAKRNPNDLAHGVRRRLENLAWLAGYREGYDPEDYRTAGSPSGDFDGVAVHSEGGELFHFDRDSFRRFLPDLASGALHPHLYLVTRPGTLWGIGSGGMARIAHRVSSDVGWDLGDHDYLAGLLRWCKALTHPIEAPDVLRRYAEAPEAAGRVLLLRVD